MVEINLIGQPQERPRDRGVWARVRFQVEDNGADAAGTG
jgi:hypothetical protein